MPWEEFRPAPAAILRRSKRKSGGRPPFATLLMLKIFVLKSPKICLMSRPSTRFETVVLHAFLGARSGIPDATTIRLFRKTLGHGQVVETHLRILRRIGRKTDCNHVGGHLINASLGLVPKQHTSRDGNATNKAGEFSTNFERQLAKRRQKIRMSGGR